jgi:TetR/AcrR family transcriptional regulator
MPKDKTQTYLKIIPCAKKEFLAKGFEKASLRVIAAAADMSAAGLYRHFADKEAMFAALVTPAVDGLKKLFITVQEDFDRLPKDEKLKNVSSYSTQQSEKLLDYIYEHFDEFKLLITCAAGTTFADFIHSLVVIEEEYTLRFIESTGNDLLTSGRATPELLHIVSSAYFAAVFEVVKHGMTKEAAQSYVASLNRFFVAGWNTLLQL